MKVYHGSFTQIETIDFSFCRKRRDFGRGFYVTKIFSQADYWATRKSEDDITQALMLDFGMSETKATDMYYSSKTFDRLADERSELYTKTWQEIYKMLKKELEL